jgi:hypothetical protein
MLGEVHPKEERALTLPGPPNIVISGIRLESMLIGTAIQGRPKLLYSNGNDTQVRASQSCQCCSPARTA